MKIDWISASLLAPVNDLVTMFASGLDLSEKVACRGINGFHHGVQVCRGETVFVSVYYGGNHTQGWVHVIGSGDRAQWVSDLLRQNYPTHRVTRMDIAEDYDDPIAWGQFERFVERLARKHHMGGSFRRFDGGLDHQNGRTIYLGSRHSTVQLRIYEKGKKDGGSPNWVRVELVVKPSKVEGKEWLASAMPAQVFGASRWASELGEFMGVQELHRVNVGTVYVKTDLDKRTLALVRQYGPTILELLKTDCDGSPQVLGEKLVGAIIQEQELRERIRSMAR